MLRKWMIAVLAVTMLFALTTTAMAADTTITVNGSGEALVPADTAVISLGVSARDKDVLNAQSRVNEAIAAIREAIIAAGIPEEDINTDYINIYAMYDYNYGEDQEQLTAYNANSTLAIRTEDMEKIGEIIDTAFEAGANTLNGINFSAKDTEKAQEAALKKAVADAKNKAQILAEASGLTIQGIAAINEGGTYSYDRGVWNNFAVKEEASAADAAYGTVVQAAKLTVSTSVVITYTVTEQAEEAAEPVTEAVQE